MKRREREIKDFSAIVDVLRRCGVIRLGLRHGDSPYVVPVSFGLEVVDGKAVVYFHSTPAGLKAACLERDRHVCVEADIFSRVEPTKIGITARYESVIGFGVARRLEGDEKLHGLRMLVEHYGYATYPLDRCRGLANTVVYKVVLEELTGKRNLPGSD